MKILITNDDGIDALGIRLLAAWAKTIGDVTVIAPNVEQSAKSHAIDIANTIEIKEVPFMDGVRAYSVDSTPADCVRFGVLGLHEKFDLVLSGVNRGVNVGADVVYSGTVAAIFEAARLHMPAIAFSAFPDGQEEAAQHFGRVYEYIMENKLFDENPLYNVNIPYNAGEIRMTQQGSPYFSDSFVLKDAAKHLYAQEGAPIPDEYPDDLSRDTVAILNGIISVTPLLSSRTNMEVFRKYHKADQE